MRKYNETYLPTGVISPLVKKMVEERDFEGRGGLSMLTYETGIDQRRLRGIITGEQANVSYTVVDRLLTKTGNFMLWYEAPYNYYHDETNTVKSIWKPPKQRTRDFPRCQGCGKRIQKRSRPKCRDCYYEECRRITSAKLLCECGNPKQRKSQTCKDCWNRRRGHPGEMSNAGGRDKYRKNTRRLFIKA